MIRIKPDEFKVLATYIYGITGIHLDDSKAYLIENRFSSLIDEYGCANYSEFYFKAKSDLSKGLEKKIINAITTNETSFYRDTSPFELLQFKLLPDLIDGRMKRSGGGSLPVSIRIWSAACSSGQEVYTVGMVLKELLVDLSRYNVKVLGTDISDQAVARASYAYYNKFEIERGLSPDKLMKYFVLEKDQYKVRDEIRGMATFRKMNLFDSFSGLGRFDIIFCRNVAIYFKEEDRIKLFNKIAQVLEPDGYLIIGSTESLTGICPQFEPKRYLRAVYYQLKGNR